MQHPPEENWSFSKYICRGQGHLFLHLCSTLLGSCCPATPPNVPGIHTWLRAPDSVLLKAGVLCALGLPSGSYQRLLGSGFFYLCVLGAITTAGFKLGLSCTRSLVANQCRSIKGDLTSSWPSASRQIVVRLLQFFVANCY